jgi:hypothetical protein
MGKDLGRILGGSTGRLTLDLRITGNARSPKVSVDTEKLVERAATNATEVLKEELEKKVFEQLGGMLGTKRDTTIQGQRTPVDSVKAARPDVRADTAKARSDTARARADTAKAKADTARAKKDTSAARPDSTKVEIKDILEGIFKRK